MKIIDALGQPCPIPVIMTKKELTDMKDGQIATLVDNEIATENLKKMSEGYGHTVEILDTDDGNYKVIITVVEGGTEIAETTDEEFVIAIGTDKMGQGDDRLGGNLIKAFIQSVTELDRKPDTMVFFNGGAKLTVKDAPTLLDIKRLHEEDDVNIITCGACLDFFELTDDLAVGDITNMFSIATILSEADRLVQL